MAIGNTGNTSSTGPLKPVPSVPAAAKLTATVAVEAGVKAKDDDKPAVTAGDVATTKPAWSSVGMPQPKDDDWPSYETLFGKTPYVKDPANPKMKDVVGAALEADPALEKTAVGAALKAGKLDAKAIMALQKHLKAAGYDLGPAGADGKLGPKTYAALVAFIDNGGKAAPPKGGAKPPNLVDGKHGMGVEIPKKPLKVDGHGTGVELPERPLKVDGHGTGVELRVSGAVDLPLDQAQIAKALKLTQLRVQNAWPHLEKALAEAGIKDRNSVMAMLAFTARESSMHAKVEFGPGAKYEGRADLGNTQPGDGKLFNGRGFIQLRGRANYEKMGKLIGVDLVANPDLAVRPDIAARIAVAHFKERGGLEAARSGDWATFNQRVGSGGAGSLAMFMQNLDALKKAIGGS